jgi:hypothetical protein
MRQLNFRLTGLICLVLLCSGCTTTSEIPAQRASKPTIANLVFVLDDALNAIGDPSADYRSIFQNILATLPNGSQDFVKAEITEFMQRAPTSGMDFKCSAEFMRYRARQELWRLKDVLLNMNPQPPEPQFCYAVPFAIDLIRSTNTVEIYGYDLDRAPLEMFLVNGDVFQDVSSALIKRTHYHLTLDLGKDRVKFSPNSQALSVAWGHLIRYTIPLIQLATPLCSSWLEEIPAGKTITYAPLLLGGEGRFREPGPRVWSNATLDYESNKVDATVCMTAADQSSNQATFSGCGGEYVFTSEWDRVIEGIFGEIEGYISYAHGSQADEVKEGLQGGPVREWKFSGFGENSGARREIQVAVELNKIRVVSTAMDACVSAIAYSEAKRMNALSAETIRRLDPQLNKVDPEISKLRPRFAP